MPQALKTLPRWFDTPRPDGDPIPIEWWEDARSAHELLALVEVLAGMLESRRTFGATRSQALDEARQWLEASGRRLQPILGGEGAEAVPQILALAPQSVPAPPPPPNFMRWLLTDPRLFERYPDPAVLASHLVADPLPFLADAKAAHQLLDILVSAAGLFDRLIADDETPGWVTFRAEAVRQAMDPWIPLPPDRGEAASFDAWLLNVMTLMHSAGLYSVPPKSTPESDTCPICRVCTLPGHRPVHSPGCRGEVFGGGDRVMGVSDSVPSSDPVIPDGLAIIREQLVTAIKGQEEAERQLRLARADADHLRELVEVLEANHDDAP